MERMPDFELKRAANLDEAVAWLAADPRCQAARRRHRPAAEPAPRHRAPHASSSTSAPCTACRTSRSADAGLRLGARVTLARLAADASIAQQVPALAEAARAVAGPGHRNAATLAGNLCLDTRCVFYNQSEWWRAANGYCLKRGGDTCHVAPQGKRCHAAFSGDLAPALLVLGAEVELVIGARNAPDRARRALPRRRRGAPDARARRGARRAFALPAAGAGPAQRLSQGPHARRDGLCARRRGLRAHAARRACSASLRVALTGTNSNPFLLAGCDEFAGRPVDADLLAQIGKRVQKQVSPMRSTVTPSNYRRLVAAVLAQRLRERTLPPAA